MKMDEYDFREKRMQRHLESLQGQHVPVVLLTRDSGAPWRLGSKGWVEVFQVSNWPGLRDWRRQASVHHCHSKLGLIVVGVGVSYPTPSPRKESMLDSASTNTGLYIGEVWNRHVLSKSES